MESKQKESKYVARSAKMSVCVPEKKEKVRLAIVCTSEERKYIKMLANYNDMTLNDFVLFCVRLHMKCIKSHMPNEETEIALDASESGEGHKKHASLDEMFNFLGI